MFWASECAAHSTALWQVFLVHQSFSHSIRTLLSFPHHFPSTSVYSCDTVRRFSVWLLPSSPHLIGRSILPMIGLEKPCGKECRLSFPSARLGYKNYLPALRKTVLKRAKYFSPSEIVECFREWWMDEWAGGLKAATWRAPDCEEYIYMEPGIGTCSPSFHTPARPDHIRSILQSQYLEFATDNMVTGILRALSSHARDMRRRGVYGILQSRSRDTTSIIITWSGYEKKGCLWDLAIKTRLTATFAGQAGVNTDKDI